MGLTDMDILFNNAVGYQLNRKKEVMLNLFQHLIIQVIKRLVATMPLTERSHIARLLSMWGAEINSA